MKFLILLTFCFASALGWAYPEETATLHGRVVDVRLGNPLPGAEVYLYSFAAGVAGETKVPPDMKLVSRTTGDAQGSYKFSGLPGGYYIIAVKLRGFFETQTVPIFVPLDPNSTLLDIGLGARRTSFGKSVILTGTVKQADKSSLMDATVTVVSAYNPQIFEQTRTDKYGRYEIYLPIFGGSQYIIYASKPGFKVSAMALPKQGSADFVLDPLS